MKRIGRVLAVLGVVLLVLVLILAGVGAWFIQRPWPQTKGTIAVAGLSSPVEVIRDKWGVPHIYAENEHDLFFAQGYVHAQDRLWQMEFNRRVGSGTLSAILGQSTLKIDRFMRTLGLRRAAELDLALLGDETRGVLDAYAAGINAYIGSHMSRLPLEFTILGAKPQPWTPLDTLTWGKVMGYNLCGNYEWELLRAGLIAELGVEAAQELIPPYPDDAQLIIPTEVQGYTWLQDKRIGAPQGLASVLGSPGAGKGSNSWVVAGSRTASGKPFLADDTHLALNMPSIWYENGLHGGRFDVVGFSFPGAPAVIIGHNSRIAWGVTNLPADVQDFYIEKLDDRSQPRRYEYEGQWQDIQVVSETIEIKGQQPVQLEVYITRHGPIMNAVLGDLEDAEPLALRWTSLEGTRLFLAVMSLNLATNWDEFRQALRDWDAPSQNFVFADLEGNIGYQTPGKIPIRPSGHQGLAPMPGWTGEYEWLGYIPFDELPSSYNPARGFIVTANNKIVPETFPYHLAYEWSAPYRAQRITDLLNADSSVTDEDVRNLHAQTYSLPGEALRPYLDVIAPEGSLQAKALELVKGWDLYVEVDSAGASTFEVWCWFLLRHTLGDELGEDLLGQYLAFESAHVPLMVRLMRQPTATWFDDTTTAGVETRDDIVKRSFAEAVSWLSQNYGDEPDKWQWGRLHTITFVHQPLGQSGIGLLEKLFNSKAVAARGDDFTVDAAWFSFSDPFSMAGGVSQRLIVDLSDWSHSVAIHSTGQSGQLFHRHRTDFVKPWQDVEYHPLLFSREAATANAEGTLTLTPP